MARGITRDKVMAAATKTVNVVECVTCSKKHLVDSDDYVVIYGDIIAGTQQAIIDGNIDNKGKVSGSIIYCRKQRCLGSLFELMLGEPFEKEDEKP